MRRSVQAVIAVADPMREGCPARLPSPKKSPTFNMPRVSAEADASAFVSEIAGLLVKELPPAGLAAGRVYVGRDPLAYPFPLNPQCALRLRSG